MSWHHHRHLLGKFYRLYEAKKKQLSLEKANAFYHMLQEWQQAIDQKQRKIAKNLRKKVSSSIQLYFPKPLFIRACSFIITLSIALSLTLLIRQLWFELYEIPTGSMRPTLQEQDRLTVSKTSFGINKPFTTGHFLFNQDEVQRAGIVIFTAENLDVPDPDTRYFYIFPGKKQLVKRIMGKPGDLLYFYGGKLYGIDKDGHDISSTLQPESLDTIDHIPFLQFDGKASLPASPSSQGIFAPVLLRQMNEKIAQLKLSKGAWQGELLSPWKEQAKDYYELFGMEHFGMIRVISKKQAWDWDGPQTDVADFYLEITHHPSIRNIRIEKDVYGRMRPFLGTSRSLIPLDRAHMERLFTNLNTVRFVVTKEKMHAYGYPKEFAHNPFFPTLTGVPDGTYEFLQGTAYKIGPQGLRFTLSKEHPIYNSSLERIQMWCNLGIECDTRFAPKQAFSPFTPRRYAYFRHGMLYVMGAPCFMPEDSHLQAFISAEENRKQKDLSYTPFIDRGIPSREEIQSHGFLIPPHHYLALGDNHAVSADSREFGFLPEENLKGTPDFIFWPPQERFGAPNQPPYPLFISSRLLIWSLAFIVVTCILWIQRRKSQIPKL